MGAFVGRKQGRSALVSAVAGALGALVGSWVSWAHSWGRGSLSLALCFAHLTDVNGFQRKLTDLNGN